MQIEPSSGEEFSEGTSPIRAPFATPGLFDFFGRVGRIQYFKVIAISALVSSVASVLTLDMKSGEGFALAGVAFIFLMLPAAYISLAAGSKRCHDLGKSGWLQLLSIIPGVNLIFGLYLLFAKGSPQSNQYGEPLVSENVDSIRPGVSNSGSSSPAEVFSGPATDSSASDSAHRARVDSLVSPGFDENAAYSAIAEELAAKCMNKGLWLKAMVEAGGGDERLQMVVYTRMRLRQLQQEFTQIEEPQVADQKVVDSGPNKIFGGLDIKLMVGEDAHSGSSEKFSELDAEKDRTPPSDSNPSLNWLIEVWPILAGAAMLIAFKAWSFAG